MFDALKLSTENRRESTDLRLLPEAHSGRNAIPRSEQTTDDQTVDRTVRGSDALERNARLQQRSARRRLLRLTRTRTRYWDCAASASGTSSCRTDWLLLRSGYWLRSHGSPPLHVSSWSNSPSFAARSQLHPPSPSFPLSLYTCTYVQFSLSFPLAR